MIAARHAGGTVDKGAPTCLIFSGERKCIWIISSVHAVVSAPSVRNNSFEKLYSAVIALTDWEI